MAKNKKYLMCKITLHSGAVVDNELKLGEAHLISKMAQENKKVEVTCIETHPEDYKAIFS